jgi:hypothetical protein
MIAVVLSTLPAGLLLSEAFSLFLKTNKLPFVLTGLGIISLLNTLAIKWYLHNWQAVREHFRKNLFETQIPVALAVVCYFLYYVLHVVPPQIREEAASIKPPIILSTIQTPNMCLLDPASCKQPPLAPRRVVQPQVLPKPAVASDQLTCQQAIEVCSTPALLQRAYIMQQKLQKFADDWKEEEDTTKSSVQQMEELHRKHFGPSPQLPAPPPGTKERDDWNRGLGFETWNTNHLIDVYKEHKQRYDNQFRTEAVQIRDELVHRYPQARTLSGYREYVDLGSYQQVYEVVAHLGNCMNALRNTP